VAAEIWARPVAAGLWVLSVVCLAGDVWLSVLLARIGAVDAGSVLWSWAIVLPAVSAATLGALIAARLPRHPVGWLLCGLGLAISLNGLLPAYTAYGALARPGSLPGAVYLAGFEWGMFPGWVTLASFVLLLSPGGHLPSARWRWPASVAAVCSAVPVGLQLFLPEPVSDSPVESPLALDVLAGPVLPVLILVCLAVVLVFLLAAVRSLRTRYRRATGVRRQQLRWLTLSARVSGLLLIVAAVAAALAVDLLVTIGLSFSIVSLVVGAWASITRYRLYDLDRVVSRTLSYGLLTVLLGGAYALIVLGLGQLAGGQESLVVAGATLAVAAVFQPARRRLQHSVDRRFDRRRYDAARTVQTFSARLRDEVDLDSVTGELHGAVERTMQPAWSSLWLRPDRPD
jgi:hypothetical protein